jgi:hypothetical protein
MINTAPTFGAAKSGGGASMGASIGAGKTMSQKVMGQKKAPMRGGMRRSAMGSAMGGGMGKSASMSMPMGGGRPMRAPNYSGPFGKIPSVGGPGGEMGGPPMGGGDRNPTPWMGGQFVSGGEPAMRRVQADGLLPADGGGGMPMPEQGPVSQGAPPMFMPPQGGMTDMSGGNQGATAGFPGGPGMQSPILSNYLQGQNQDPRFRY